MVPDFADGDGNIGLRIQALVLEVGDRRLLVGPCVGNGKTLTMPFCDDQSWPFMDRFEAAGFHVDRLRLAPSGGHTPGHVSLWIESGCERGLISGDIVHHPCAVRRDRVDA